MDIEVRVIAMGADAHKVNPDLLSAIQAAAQTMAEKNTMRGDGWRAVGVMGSFIDLHTCYCRLRGLIWDRPPRMKDAAWQAEVINACQDARNYTILIEMSLDADLLLGLADISKLKCPHCGLAHLSAEVEEA